MRTLYHYPLCPFSRKIRILLEEKKLSYTLVYEPYWEARSDFVALNPAGTLPVFIDPYDGRDVTLADSMAIAEYIDETYETPDPPFIGPTPLHRAEVRRLCAWFDRKFNEEVTLNLVYEKIVKRHTLGAGPDSTYVRSGYENIKYHLKYIDWLLHYRHWLAGNHISLADITAAAHLSCVDYIGDVPWDNHPETHEWYARIKSRPSMRPLLVDRIEGSNPARHYHDLDF